MAGFQFATTWAGMYLSLILGSEEAAGQASLGWLVLLLAIFVPLCAARYSRA